LPIGLSFSTPFTSGTTPDAFVYNSNKWTVAPGNWGLLTLCGSSSSGNVLRNELTSGVFGLNLAAGDFVQTRTGVAQGPVSQGLQARLGTLGAGSATCKPKDANAVTIPLVDFGGTCCDGAIPSSLCTPTNTLVNGNAAVPVCGFYSACITNVDNSANITVSDVSFVSELGVSNPNTVGSVAFKGSRGWPLLIH
jgi:hypothetical protein